MAFNLSKYFINYLEGLGAQRCFKLCLTGSFNIGMLDYLSGPELSFSVFYTVPIMLVAWFGGKKEGLILAVISAGIWISVDLVSGAQYNLLLTPLWNTLARLAFFLIIFGSKNL